MNDKKNSSPPGAMSPEAREAKNAYLRAWRKRNPDRCRETLARYWQRKADEAAQQRTV